jgi:hypothetical protein
MEAQRCSEPSTVFGSAFDYRESVQQVAFPEQLALKVQTYFLP